MELTVKKADLLRELSLFQGIVERKNTIPVLGNVLLDADGDGVKLTATDLEIALRSGCPAAVVTRGSLTLPAKKLFEILRALPETDVRITQGTAGVRVAADRFDSRMQALPREDFPTLPDAPGGRVALPRAALREMVAKTQFAITGDDTRYFLNGAKFEVTPESLRLVATDGHRLAMVTVRHASVGTAPLGVILPAKTLSELGKLLADGDGEIGFARGENHLFFEVDGRTLVSRMIDGTFPAYERVIPTGNDRHVTVERDRLASAVKRVALLSNERTRAVTFEIAPGTADVTSVSSEFGEAREQLAVEYAGAPIRIQFNAGYVLEFLGVVETDSVLLSLKDEVSQAVMEPVGAQGYDYTYVLMPMRI